ncbi:MAG TPA: phosphatase PAP2 family protein [Thermoanaerobaculia bacterium]|nr:phosphatase PAP2 family protein [Thermoanaerobaculia bacterium]
MRLRPLEAINLATLSVLSALTLWLSGRLQDPGGILIRYGLMAAFLGAVALVVRRKAPLSPPLSVAVDFYPAAMIPVLYESLGPLIPAARGVVRDDLLIAADRALFGLDPTVWLERFVRPWLTDFFSISYLTYYFIAIFLGGVLWRRDRGAGRRFIFTLTLCYLVSYAGYFLLPALGPRFALAAEQKAVLETTPISRAISSTLNDLEHTRFDVFPSGHTMIAVAVLLVAFRRARDVFWFLLPVAVCLVISTVYCRYHYVVDVLAGMLLAVLTVPLGDRLYDRLASDSRYRARS